MHSRQRSSGMQIYFHRKFAENILGSPALAEKEFLAVLPEEIVLSADSGKAKGRIIDKQFSGSNVDTLLISADNSSKRFARLQIEV